MYNGMEMPLETALSVGSENAHSESGTEFILPSLPLRLKFLQDPGKAPGCSPVRIGEMVSFVPFEAAGDALRAQLRV